MGDDSQQGGAGAAIETSFVPAPDDEPDNHDVIRSMAGAGEEGKLMIVGHPCCCNRNKIPSLPYDAKSCYKPAGLSRLSNALFHGFVMDLQLTMRQRWTIFWPVSITFFTIIEILPMILPMQYLAVYGVACFAALVSLGYGRHVQLQDLNCEMQARIQEWKSPFEEQGFSVDYVVDKKHLWTVTETYIHIHRSSGPSVHQPQYEEEEEEAKFLLLFPRLLFRHRNNTFRVVPISRTPSTWNFTKPPALRSLSEDVFRSLMKDIDTSMRNVSIKKGIVIFLFAFLWVLVGYNYAIMPLFILLFLVEQLVLDHLPILNSQIKNKIEEWKPRMEAEGFAIEYLVDQPAWYKWREGYIHIYRVKNLSPRVP